MSLKQNDQYNEAEQETKQEQEYMEKKHGKDNLPNCELCGTDWFDETNDSLVEDYESIDENKRCTGCYEEWGDGWSDRV